MTSERWKRRDFLSLISSQNVEISNQEVIKQLFNSAFV